MRGDVLGVLTVGTRHLEPLTHCIQVSSFFLQVVLLHYLILQLPYSIICSSSSQVKYYYHIYFWLAAFYKNVLGWL